eukprot:4972918-Lingulodinium_polyedra.AAC.1
MVAPTPARTFRSRRQSGGTAGGRRRVTGVGATAPFVTRSKLGSYKARCFGSCEYRSFAARISPNAEPGVISGSGAS